MAVAVGALNLVLGTVYTCYGLLTAVDLRRGWSTRGFSHFGVAWLVMAFTCGPHHLDHGLHVLLGGRSGGWLDLAVVAAGFPFGVVWFLLRVEALLGGRGDRDVAGTPAWLAAAPTAAASYLVLVLAAVIGITGRADAVVARTVPNLLLVGLYAAIDMLLLRTQVRNRAVTAGWSVSGLSLAAVMLTCAVMHGVFVAYATTGRYDLDGHGLVIDTVAVPAAAYFLWVTYLLDRGWLRDWNDSAPGADLASAPAGG